MTASHAPGPAYFNPRSRVGSDVAAKAAGQKSKLFQSTLPCRERPAVRTLRRGSNNISIHAPV